VSNPTIARRYARAIFELGRERGELVALRRDLDALAELERESEPLRAALTSPSTADDQRDQIMADLSALLQSNPYAANLVRLLARRRRLSLLSELVRQFGELVDEHDGVVRATVRSAAELSADYVSRLGAELEKALGKKVVVTVEQDPSLIAGLVTQIGDQVIDGSLRGKLDRLRESLHQS
jgi:F-type H+-transporting ATPase subunit delta